MDADEIETAILKFLKKRKGATFADFTATHAELDGTKGGTWRAPARRVWTRLLKSELITHAEDGGAHLYFCELHDRLCAADESSRAFLHVLTDAGLAALKPAPNAKKKKSAKKR